MSEPLSRSKRGEPDKIGTANGESVGMDGTGPGANSSMLRLEEADLTVLTIDNVAPDQGATEILRDEIVGLVLGSTLNDLSPSHFSFPEEGRT